MTSCLTRPKKRGARGNGVTTSLKWTDEGRTCFCGFSRGLLFWPSQVWRESKAGRDEIRSGRLVIEIRLLTGAVVTSGQSVLVFAHNRKISVLSGVGSAWRHADAWPSCSKASCFLTAGHRGIQTKTQTAASFQDRLGILLLCHQAWLRRGGASGWGLRSFNRQRVNVLVLF